MADPRYSNFVRPSQPAPSDSRINALQVRLDGEKAMKLYLEEVPEVNNDVTGYSEVPENRKSKVKSQIKRKINTADISNKKLFLSTQNNDVDIVKQMLDTCPDKINAIDEFGWSLLMIACQANSVETVKELLKRGIDTSVRDKAGNSAQNLVIQNNNLILADLLLNHKYKDTLEGTIKEKVKKVKLKESVTCEICNKTYPDKEEHLSSTVHNLNASKGRKIPASYVIPQSNRGYQLMLKVGWDKESGLGPHGNGKKYPIKSVKKEDRKGLGHGIKKSSQKQETNKTQVNKRTMAQDLHRSKRMEVKFRREFY